MVKGTRENPFESGRYGMVTARAASDRVVFSTTTRGWTLQGLPHPVIDAVEIRDRDRGFRRTHAADDLVDVFGGDPFRARSAAG